MFKVSILIWIMLGTVLAGTSMIVVLIVPSLAGQAIKNIPDAVALGFVFAMPLSYLVARQIGGDDKAPAGCELWMSRLARHFALAYRPTHAVEIEHLGGGLSASLPD